MNLTGKYLESNGTFEIKEVSHISQAGQLLANNTFATGDFTGWTTAIYGVLEVTTYAGKTMAHLSRTGTFNTLISQSSILTATRKYRLQCDVVVISGSPIVHFGGYQIYLTTGKLDVSVTATFGTVAFQTLLSGDEFYVGNIYVEEVTTGYPLLDKGDKYLECTSSGAVSMSSKQAYGTWEFDVRHGIGEQRIYFMGNYRFGGYGTTNGYMLYLTSNEGIALYSSSPNTQLFITSNDYIEVDQWYKFKITRTLNGEFYVYIKGGSFGVDSWTLITPSAGSNPVTNLNHLVSEYFVVDIDATGNKDAIANIKMTEGVEQ